MPFVPCCGMVLPLEAASVEGLRWTLSLNVAPVEGLRNVDTVVEWRLSFPVVGWLRNRRLLLWNYVCVEQCLKSIQIASRGKANGVLIFWIWQIVVKVIE